MTPNPPPSSPDLATKFTNEKVRKDIKVLARFVQIYCDGHHKDAPREPMTFRFLDFPSLLGNPLNLCEECKKLLSHAATKRALCPHDPKPACKHCPNHCYAPKYRQQIREAMKYSGRKMVLTGRLDYLLKLFF